MIKSTTSILILAIAVSIVYAATLSYPWHFDDTPNILDNPTVHISNLSTESIFNSLNGAISIIEYRRALAYLSFAVNWYFGKQNTFGYHLVNIAIHLLTAIILFKSIILLFKSPKLKELYSDRTICHIALLTSLLWALHPIQIQAVTYIVQRMASMAAFFYILAFMFYLKGRMEQQKFKIILFSLLCAISYCLAVFSKENAAFLPVIFLFTEIAFFGNERGLRAQVFKKTLILICGVIIASSLYFIINKYLSVEFLEPFPNRYFSIYERLLTQPRILLFYLGLILYPLPIRFSLVHDFEKSVSFIEPWTTLPSLFLVILLFLLSIIYIRRWPLICFPVLFFFVNHIIESSIIPLEMIFEHRNYLPTLFIFLPVSILLINGIAFYTKRSRFVLCSLYVFLVGIIFLLGWSTYLRNNIWSSHEILWKDAHIKAPNSARPLAYLGQIYGWEKKRSDINANKAIGFYYLAKDKYLSSEPLKNQIIGNIGGLYLNNNYYNEAKKYYKTALQNDPSLHNFRFGYARTLYFLQEFSESLKNLEFILAHAKEVYNIHRALNMAGQIRLWQGEYGKAVDNFGKAIRSTKNKKLYFYNVGVAYSLVGKYKKASMFLKWAQIHYPKNIRVYLSRIENAVRMGDQKLAKKLSNELCNFFRISDIKELFQIREVERYRSVPLNLELIRPHIKRAIHEIGFSFPL